MYRAWNAALAEVRQQSTSYPVPNHLRNAPTKLMAQQGYGAQYRYAHDEPHLMRQSVIFLMKWLCRVIISRMIVA